MSSPVTIRIEQSFATAVAPSPRVMQTAAMFGLGVDDQRELAVVPPTQITLPRGGVAFITGPSGGGKSTVLRLIDAACVAKGMATLSFDDLPALPDAPLVDCFDRSLEETTKLLARVGLGDAFVMLRRPRELSDGQRYRLRLAQTIDRVERRGEASIILADEFGATLDRITAKVIARHIRRWVSRTIHTFVCATTHDDLLEALEPQVLIVKDLGAAIGVHTR
jgi:ABC-type ATPase with predicted acetyltransferase domain